MIGMGVGIDDQVQLEAVVGEHREIPFDVGVERVYQNRVSPAIVGYQIGLAAFAVELAQDHGRLIGGVFVACPVPRSNARATISRT